MKFSWVLRTVVGSGTVELEGVYCQDGKEEQKEVHEGWLGLGTSALVGDPDPYPRVFGRQISHPDP